MKYKVREYFYIELCHLVAWYSIVKYIELFQTTGIITFYFLSGNLLRSRSVIVELSRIESYSGFLSFWFIANFLYLLVLEAFYLVS